jgi:hypothetical protein
VVRERVTNSANAITAMRRTFSTPEWSFILGYSSPCRLLTVRARTSAPDYV